MKKSKSENALFSIPIKVIMDKIHANAKEKGFWINYETVRDHKNIEEDLKEDILREIISSKIALCHSELSEGLEGLRKDNIKFTKPKDGSLEEEIADTIIRLLDVCAILGLENIGDTVITKHSYNTTRSKKHGKKF